MTEHGEQPSQNIEDIDLRPENPYSKAYYEFAEMQGERFFNKLEGEGLTPKQINGVLSSMTVELGLTGAMSANESERNARVENRDALEHGSNWSLAVIAEAQKSLAQKNGEGAISPGNDIRKRDAAPQNKYLPPKR